MTVVRGVSVLQNEYRYSRHRYQYRKSVSVQALETGILQHVLAKQQYRNSLALWEPIMDKFRARLEDWKGKFLSFVGRVTLVKVSPEKLADKVAAAGFYAVVPDFFDGDPYVSDKPDRPFTVWIRIMDRLAKGFEDAKLIIDALKIKGALSIEAGGFCWGIAKVMVELSKVALIQAAVILHPLFVTVDDIKGRGGHG
ncbi:hypothetical protein GQ457_01G024340 [Hibiscus cannabinus]